MSRFDIVSNHFWSNPYRFASFMNTNLFNGKELVQPENLVSVDRKYDSCVRDVLMLWKTKEQRIYLAVENQLV